MKRPCLGVTKSGRPCKGTASPWPDGVGGDPQLCGTHLPRDLAVVRDTGFAEIERRFQERLAARSPACWSWTVPPFRELDEKAARAALKDWHAGRCAACGYQDRLVLDHDHETGLVRGWLCRSCNGQEPHDNGLFGKYRARPPVAMLGLQLRYWDPFHGWAQPSDPSRRQLDNHPAYTLAAGLAERLQPEGEA